MIISTLQQSKFSQLIKSEANKLGFFACGISKAGHLPNHEAKVEEWLAEGKHAGMTWMERNKEKRYNPEKLVDKAKSIITVLFPYTPNEKILKEDSYKISSYAYGADYHKVVKDRLFNLLEFIHELAGKRKARVFVDSAPVLDRAWAHKAGLGFIGKNTLLINREGGSYFFIGHIVLDLVLDYEEQTPEKNFCGSCTLCLKACPTQALEPFVLDSNKCISYLTIEHHGPIPEKYRESFDNWIFGCDICQEVCPWNREAKPHNESEFEPSDQLKSMAKSDWAELDEETFEEMFSKSAVMRTGFAGIKRNIRYLED